MTLFIVLEFKPVIVTFKTVVNKPNTIAAVLIRQVVFFFFEVVLPLDANIANKDIFKV